MTIPKLRTIRKQRTTPKEKHTQSPSIKEISPPKTQVVTLWDKNAKIIKSDAMTRI